MTQFVLLAFRNVFRNRRRTVMTILIVTVGVSGLIVSGGFFAYMFDRLAEGTIHFGIGHLQVHNPAHYDDVIAAARRIPHVLDAAPRVSFFGMASSGLRSDTFMGMGVDPAAERRMDFSLHITGGHDLASDDEILLADGLARYLRVQPGDTIKLIVTGGGGINYLDVRVAGTYNVGMREVDDHALRLTVPAAQKLVGSNRASMVVIGLDATVNTDAAYAALARSRPDLKITKWVDLATFYRQCRGLFDNIFAFSGAIVFIMVVMSSANTMMMSMFERTREIGAMLAMGTPRSWILALFMTEGLVTGVMGAITGVSFGRFVGELLNRSGWEIPPPPATDMPLPFHVLFHPAIILTASVLVVITLVVASLAPAIRASRLKIVEALAHV